VIPLDWNLRDPEEHIDVETMPTVIPLQGTLVINQGETDKVLPKVMEKFTAVARRSIMISITKGKTALLMMMMIMMMIATITTTTTKMMMMMMMMMMTKTKTLSMVKVVVMMKTFTVMERSIHANYRHANPFPAKTHPL
jgi:hypothetical protein